MSLEKPIFWLSESNPAKVIAISTLLLQKWKNYDLTLVPHPMLIKFQFLIFGHVILVHTFLTRPSQHFYRFQFLIYNPMSQ